MRLDWTFITIIVIKSQIRSFEEHIKASIELNVPLIVHSRNAEKDTYDILKILK